MKHLMLLRLYWKSEYWSLDTIEQNDFFLDIKKKKLKNENEELFLDEVP